MYDYIPYICAGIFFILGLFMTNMPNKSVKKDQRDEVTIKKARKNGIIMMILAVLFALLLIFTK